MPINQWLVMPANYTDETTGIIFSDYRAAYEYMRIEEKRQPTVCFKLPRRPIRDSAELVAGD